MSLHSPAGGDAVLIKVAQEETIADTSEVNTAIQRLIPRELAGTDSTVEISAEGLRLMDASTTPAREPRCEYC